MTPILVTGASGYLGHYMLRWLIAEGMPFVATSRSGDVGVRWDLLREPPPDRVAAIPVVLHLAAVVPKTMADYADETAAAQNVAMVQALLAYPWRVVFASSHVAAHPTTAYARSKAASEHLVAEAGGVIVRLPGLFGLPRRSGVIYEAAKRGVIPDSFGPSPAMAVEDAARALVQILQTLPAHSQPLDVVYGTRTQFDQRVQELVRQCAH